VYWALSQIALLPDVYAVAFALATVEVAVVPCWYVTKAPVKFSVVDVSTVELNHALKLWT
jgi:hypothetical protein